MTSLQNPLDAYRFDLAKQETREDFGGSDTMWLLAAHCLYRLARCDLSERDRMARQAAVALADYRQPDWQGRVLPEKELRDLDLVIAGLRNLMDRRGMDSLSCGVRGMASRMVDAGALALAYSMLTHARLVATGASDRERALLTADQAYVMRLLGDLDGADELYAVAEEIGRNAEDFAILARAAVGRGVIQRVRGNYPRARVQFERALELAETSGATELMLLAHQGLTICHAIGRNLDKALRHAWRTYELAKGQPVKEVEALVKLAQLTLDSGYPREALRGFLAAIGRTDSLRVVLGALGGAALAAGEAGLRNALNRIAAELERRISLSALPYENCQALYHLGCAYAAAGDEERSQRYLSRARKLAKARNFYELIHKTEQPELMRAAYRDVGPHELSDASRTVVAAVASLELGEAGALAVSDP
jgi:tetratricopeptide (TPR) repeat protein